MSLLLDALKKAATEKEKINTGQDKEIEEPVIEVDESADLDLDLDTSALDDMAPEIDEDIDLDNSISAEEVEPEKTDSEISDLETTDKGRPDAEKVEPEKQQVEEIEPTIQPVVKKEYGIENKEALSELINKSNKHSKRNKLRRNIGIASIILFVFSMTATYLYIEFSSESQDIYVSSNVDRVQRPKPAIKTEGVKTQAAIRSEQKAVKPVSVKAAARFKKSAVKQTLEKITKEKPIIRIIHKKVDDPVGSMVLKAYALFNKGDYKASENIYKKVIRKDARNRDGLLGLAAIAIKQQRYEYARQRYLQLRHLNPKDSIAIAGLSTIENKTKPDLSVSDIRLMLREQPDAAHLYFALGAIFTKQKKWADAQASFFSAWSGESKNADYAYNLAISLDRLGKTKQARQFYELSLKLNRKKKGNFKQEIAEKRINTLNEHND